MGVVVRSVSCLGTGYKKCSGDGGRGQMAPCAEGRDRGTTISRMSRRFASQRSRLVTSPAGSPFPTDISTPPPLHPAPLAPSPPRPLSTPAHAHPVTRFCHTGMEGGGGGGEEEWEWCAIVLLFVSGFFGKRSDKHFRQQTKFFYCVFYLFYTCIV